ncbi:PilW family protein [Methylophaga sp.]|uniref:PilW family protein n=1 Tax=Methylophaga sp. TaxID=2024840 RepID=UPI003F6990D3
MNAIKQKGFTLIELMVALILSLIVMATILTIFISNVKSSAENIQMMQLNQELRTAMTFMSDELKRHGYSSNSTSTAMNTLDTNTASCVIYGYTASGAAPTIRGFRLEAGDLEWCSDNASGCATGNCPASGWQDITTTGVTTIETFTVNDLNSTPAGSVTVERLDITLTGRRQLNPGTARRTMQETIRIRNEAP